LRWTWIQSWVLTRRCWKYWKLWCERTPQATERIQCLGSTRRHSRMHVGVRCGSSKTTQRPKMYKSPAYVHKSQVKIHFQQFLNRSEGGARRVCPHLFLHRVHLAVDQLQLANVPCVVVPEIDDETLLACRTSPCTGRC
jgi:hypothetical protein